MEITKSEKIFQGQAITYANLAVLYHKQQRYEDELRVLQEGLQLVEEKGMLFMQPFMQLEIGHALFNLNRLEESDEFISKGLKNSKERGRPIDVIQGYTYQAEIQIEQQKFSAARINALEGYQLATQIDDLRQTAKLAGQLSVINEQLGNSGEALRFYKIESRLRDSIFNEENTRELIRQEYQYDFEKKAYQDSLANAAALEIQEADLKRRSLIIWFLIGVLALLGVFGWVLLSRYRLIAQQRKRIQEEKEKAESANAKLREIDESKSRFFTNISHEFRTPLTVISGMAEQMKEDGRVKNLIQRNTNQLLQLINQILDLRKLESGSLPTHFVQGDVSKYLQYILESLSSLAEDKKVKLIFGAKEQPLMADYDPEKLLRIVSNLLSNALKFTPEGGEVRLFVEPGEAGTYRFTVTDTGLGIPKEKLPYIFDRFYQVDDSVSRTGEGTGIGLTLTKEMVGLLNGTIKADSQEGARDNLHGGASFFPKGAEGRSRQ